MKNPMKKITRAIAVVLLAEMIAACIFPHFQLNSGFLTSALAAESGTTGSEGTEDEPVFDASMAGQYVINVGSEYYRETSEITVNGDMTLQLMHVDQNGNPKPIEVAKGATINITWVSVDDGSDTSTVFDVEGVDKTGSHIKSFCNIKVKGVGYNNLSVEVYTKDAEGNEAFLQLSWKLHVALAIDNKNLTFTAGEDVAPGDTSGNGQYGLRYGLNTDKVMDTLQISGPEVRGTDKEKYNKYLLMLKRKDLIYTYTNGKGETIELDNFSDENDIEQDPKLRAMLSEKVVWTTSNSDVATVKYGVITGQGAGTAVITATTYSDDHLSERSVSITVVVKPSAKVVGVTDEFVSECKTRVESSSFTIQTNAKAASELVWTVRNKDEKGNILWSNEISVTTDKFSADPYSTSGSIYFSKVKAGTYYITARVDSKYGELNSMVKKLAFTIVVPVSIDATILYMNVGDTYSIIENSTIPNPRWYSYLTEDEGVADVGNDGVIKATGKGNTTITLTRVENGGYTEVFPESDYNEVPGVKTIRVEVIDSILINYSSATIYIGSTLNMKATTTSNNIVTWESSDSKVASVDELGIVTGLKEGTATITAVQIVNGVRKTSSCRLTVRQGVTGVTLDPAEKEIALGDNLTINAKVEPSLNGVSLKWVSSDEKVIEVSVSGDLSATVKAVGTGTAVVSAINQENVVVGSCLITVFEPIEKITLSQTNVVLPLSAGWFQLYATIVPASAEDREIIWTSTNSSVATVDKNGIVTLKKPGLTSIIVSSKIDAGVTAICNLEVTKSVTGVKLDKSTHDMFVGETFRISYTIAPSGASNAEVVWSSSNNAVAAVDQSGLITAKGVGTTVIMVKTKDGGFTALCTVNVGRVATAIKLDVTSLVLNAGEYYYLEATLTPADTTDKTVMYESSDTKIAVVSKKGKITAKKAGACVVMAKTKSGSMAYCAITVMQGVTGVQLSDNILEIPVGETYEMEANVLPKNASNKNVKWSSSNEEIFTVDEEGEIEGIGGGVAVLTCTTEEGGFMDYCVVTVIEEVTTVQLDKNSYKLGLNSTYQLVATVSGERATNKDVIWSSTDPDVVSVDDNGRITGLELGYATIMCEAADGSGASDICEVRVCKLVTNIQLDVSYLTLIQGKSYELQATVEPDDATYMQPVWTSDDTEIAIVSPKGVITALNPGSTMIHATADDSGAVSAICYVNVIKPVMATNISVSESEIVMSPGENRTVAIALVPNNTTENITWSSDNTAVATVDSETGLITAKAIGTANINILTESGRKGTIKVFVVGLSRTYVELQQYTNLLLKLEVDGGGSSNFSVRWDVDDQNVATVQNGRVTAKALGTTTVYAVVNGRRMSCVVKVVKIK